MDLYLFFGNKAEISRSRKLENEGNMWNLYSIFKQLNAYVDLYSALPLL